MVDRSGRQASPKTHEGLLCGTAATDLSLLALCLQAQGYCGHPMKYKGMLDVLQQAVRKEGVRGLYKVLSHHPSCLETRCHENPAWRAVCRNP